MRLLLIILGLFSISALHAQSINTEFGKNRVQYHDDFDTWFVYETENFLTYYYGKSRNVAVVALQMAEQVHKDVQNIMEHRTNDKIKMLIYTDISDLRQSNIGLDDSFTSSPGETKIIGNKMFVYYDGNHQHLRRQIREGIASVYLSSMQFGDNVQEIIQNAVLLNLPEWYKRGVISYVGTTWDALIDDELRDILDKNPKYYDFKKLAQDYPKIAGHSMWFYIDQYYGKSNIPNILYLTRITRKIDNSLLYVLNEDLKSLSTGWKEYFKQHYSDEPASWKIENNESAELSLGKKGHVPVSIMKLSPDGIRLAYVDNHIGKATVRVKNLLTGEEEKVIRVGVKNNLQAADYDYPQLAWHPGGEEMTIIYEKKDIMYIRKYHIPSGEYVEEIIPEAFQRIYSFDYWDDDRYVFSANTDGFSDLHMFNFIGRRHNRISDDFYDDLDIQVTELGGKRGVLFSSNRLNNNFKELSYDTIIPDHTFDLFFYDLETDDKSLLRLTQTSDIDERHPIKVSEDKIVYLADKSGMTNRYVFDLATNNTHASSNKGRNIIRHTSSLSSPLHIHTYYEDGDYKVYIDSVDWSERVVLYKTKYYNRDRDIDEFSESEVFIPFKPADHYDTDIPDNMKFQTEYDDQVTLEPIEIKGEDSGENKQIFISEAVKDEKVHQFVSQDARAALLAFRLDNFVTKADNEVLFEGLETYTGNSDRILNTPMGFLLKADVTDLFEDYRLTGGARIPFSLNGAEYFLTFADNRKLWDKRYALYRRTITEVVDNTVFPATKAKKTSWLGMARYSYPWSVYRSLRLTGSLRFDNYFLQVTDQISFNSPAVNEKRLSLKAEYIYDNTMDYAINIKHGTRYKFYAEAINEFNIQFVDGFQASLSDGFTTVMGYDARHYIPLLRHSVVALRSAGATSFGNKKNLYYLGGVNNAIRNPFNESIPLNTTENFAYKTNAFHLRGFDSNIRNGSSYALINTEIRMPVFRYLFGNRASRFWKNLQFVGFFDAGAAWYGASPYSDKNPLNIVNVNAGDIVELEVQYYRDPLVMGYGGGIRFSLLSYMIRLDYARGIETRVVQSPKFHLSIGADF